MKTLNNLRNAICISMITAAPVLMAQDASTVPVLEPSLAAKLPGGTIVTLETITEMSSANLSVGQSVPLRVKYDVIVRGKVLIKGGAMASGQVTAVESRGSMGRKGSFNMRPTVAQAVDGQMVVLTNGSMASAGESKVGGSVALAAAVSPLFLLKKGKDAVIPPGYELQGTVANNTDLDLASIP